jgi:uncharacterized membrane protein
MSDPSARTFSSDFKRFFVRGLVVVLPTVLTLWIVVKAYQFIDSAIAEPINRSVRMGMANAAPYWPLIRENFDPTEQQIDLALLAWKPEQDLPAAASNIDRAIASSGTIAPTRDEMLYRLRVRNINQWWAAHWYMNLIGIIVAVVGVYIAGRLLGGYLGRRVYRKIERVITSLPIFKQVYPYVKQVVDFIFGEDPALKFNRVVIIEYPSKGIWSIGFQTGPAIADTEQYGNDCVSVFIPSSPTPFTGYAVVVPRKGVVELPISVEQALRYIVSGGVLVPERASPDLEMTPAGLIPIPSDFAAVSAAPAAPSTPTKAHS